MKFAVAFALVALLAAAAPAMAGGERLSGGTGGVSVCQLERPPADPRAPRRRVCRDP
jgi:hypothetical protein